MNITFGAGYGRIEFGRSPKQYTGEEAWKNKVDPDLIRRIEQFDKNGQEELHTITLRFRPGKKDFFSRVMQAGLDLFSAMPSPDIMLGRIPTSKLRDLAKLDEITAINPGLPWDPTK